jgi:hypothetical protein
MITSFEVGAVFKIVNEASPALTRILKQVRALRAEFDKARVAMSEFAAFKPPPGLTTAIGKTDELALSWKGVTEQASRANAAMAKAAAAARGGVAFSPAGAGSGGGNRGIFRPGARGGAYGGGAHVSGPGASIPGGGHVRFGGGAMAAAGLLGYGVDGRVRLRA